MRGLRILAPLTLACCGCGDAAPSKANHSAEPPQVMIVEERPVVSPRLQRVEQPAAITAEEPLPKVAEAQLDPLFTLWKYPGSTAEETFAFDEMRSVKYLTRDPLAKVAEFYREKMPDSARIAADSAKFGPRFERGQALSISLAPVPGGTLITLRLDR